MQITHIIKTIDGAEFGITEEQMLKIIRAHDAGEKRVFVQGAWLNINTMNIYPVGALPQNEGYLHDGTRVIKKFGQWVDAKNPDVRLDPAYYPEIAQDRVLTRVEHESRSVGHLVSAQEKPALEMSRGQGGFEAIGEIAGEREALDA